MKVMFVLILNLVNFGGMNDVKYRVVDYYDDFQVCAEEGNHLIKRMQRRGQIYRGMLVVTNCIPIQVTEA